MDTNVKADGFINEYLNAQANLMRALPVEKINSLIQIFVKAWQEDRQIFAFGNGGSAANASHFITDLSKGASDALPRRFRGMSLNDNMPWMTALANDYNYDEVFVRQLMNFARKDDLVMVMSVSGNSQNLVKAVTWAKQNGIFTVALVGGKKGQLADLVDFVIVTDSDHYGRVEDAHMGICHIVCYYLMEKLKAN